MHNLTRLVISSLAVLVGTSTMIEAFYSRQHEGWFWYQALPNDLDDDDIDERFVLPHDKEMSEIQTQGTEDPLIFSTAWFRTNMSEYLDKAIDSPSWDNIKTYFYLQKIMMDKSELFTKISEEVVLTDPLLDEGQRRPLAPFASSTLDKLANTKKREVLKELSRKTGIYFFFKSDCPYCHIQAPILKALQENVGLTILPVSLDAKPLPNTLFDDFLTDDGLSQLLNIQSVPALFLMGQEELIPLSQGILSYEELTERLLMVSKNAQLITQEAYQSTRTVITSDQRLDLINEQMYEYLKKQGIQ